MTVVQTRRSRFPFYYLEEFNLSEIEYTEKDTKIKVSKNNVQISNQSPASNTPLDQILKDKEDSILDTSVDDK